MKKPEPHAIDGAQIDRFLASADKKLAARFRHARFRQVDKRNETI
jgi:hypothetical protein